MIQGTTPGIGRQTEALALDYLNRQGLTLRERNFRCRRGEIDLVMQDRACIVFVEVRYRRDRRHGSPAETIDQRKQQKLLLAARYYLHTHAETRGTPARFDVVALSPGATGLEIEWIRNAFGA